MQHNQSHQFSQQPVSFSSLHHSFDVALAAEYKSVELAILIHHFQFWIVQNKRLERNFHEGRTWMYQTIKEITAIFPYWSKKQVEKLLTKAVQLGILIKNNFNKSKFDRTAWYAFADEVKFGISAFEKMEDFPDDENASDGEIDFPKRGNGSPQKGTPIPDTKTDNNKEKNIAKKETPPPAAMSAPPSASGLVCFFYQKLKEINPMAKDPNWKKAEQVFERMIRIDGRSEEDINGAINFMVEQFHSPEANCFFWFKVVQSADSFRKNFASIWMSKIAREKKPPPERNLKKKMEFFQQNRKWIDQFQKQITGKLPRKDSLLITGTGVFLRNSKGHTEIIDFDENGFTERVENFFRKDGIKL
jgi:hypothetical protein